MSNQTRRQNLGLGKTAAGGSGGSFASHLRAEAAPPPSELDVTDNAAPVTEDSVLNLLNDFDLDHGNAEIELEDGYLNVEAPGHARVYVDFTSMDGTNTMADAKRMIAEQLHSFDPDQEFNEVWSPEFGNREGYTPTEFLRSLESDQRHFVKQADALTASADAAPRPAQVAAPEPAPAQVGLSLEQAAQRRIPEYFARSHEQVQGNPVYTYEEVNKEMESIPGYDWHRDDDSREWINGYDGNTGTWYRASDLYPEDRVLRDPVTVDSLMAMDEGGSLHSYTEQLKSDVNRSLTGRLHLMEQHPEIKLSAIDTTDFLLRVMEDDAVRDPQFRSGEDDRVPHYLNQAQRIAAARSDDEFLAAFGIHRE